MTTEAVPQVFRLSDHLCKMRGTDEICDVYKKMWNFKGRFIVIKGGKGSGKSKTVALRWIYFLMKYPGSNLLVIRKVFDTLRTSCFNDLLWAIEELKVQKLWKVTYSPMEMTYIPTNQKILFKGADKAEKVGSTSVVTGILCWCWFEEFYEIPTEDDFDKISFSIRGDLKSYPHLWIQIVCTMNPWSSTWIRDKFFDHPNPDVFSGTTTYRDNDRLDDAYIRMCEDMYIHDPRRAKIYCDGEFGISEGLIYSNWVEEDFDIHHLVATRPGLKLTYGLDFGYKISYNAFVAVAVDLTARELWIFDEYYEHGVPNMDIAKAIIGKGYGKEEIWADAAEPKSIFELQTGLIEAVDTGEVDAEGMPIKNHITWQLPGIRPALKGPDSVRQGISTLQGFKMHVSPRCPNTIIELNNYCYDQDKEGKFTGKPIKDFDHIMDALRYSTTKLFVRARGHVAEARGMDSIGSPTTPIKMNGVQGTATIMGPNESVPGGHKRVRRVFSTH